MIKNILLATALVSCFATAPFADPVLMRFDVAENHTLFSFAPAPVHESGMPAHGNPFITQGFVYPAGTLSGDTVGVLENGTPAFPELVLGTWTCDGWFVGEGGNAQSGVWLVSRQIVHLNDGDVIVTQGTELADVGVQNIRPITGSTGDYAGLDGEMLQTLLGFNEFMGVNATFEISASKGHASLR